MFFKKLNEPVPPPLKTAPSVWTVPLVEQFRKADYCMVKLTSLTLNAAFQQTAGCEVHYGCICKGKVQHFNGGLVTCFLSFEASLKVNKPVADLGSLDGELTVCVDSNDEAMFTKLAEAFEWAALSKRPYVYVSLHNRSSQGRSSTNFLLDHIHVYASINLLPDTHR